jgi:hypothetical protein
MAERNGVTFEDIEGFVAIPNWREIPREMKLALYAVEDKVVSDRVKDGDRMVFIREDVVDSVEGLRSLIVHG